jgi:PAS domain S-box-containing protein
VRKDFGEIRLVDGRAGGPSLHRAWGADEQFRLLVESVEDYAIFMLDPTGHVATWNPGAERIKGYRPEDIIGQHFSRFYSSEDLARGKPERALKVAAAMSRFEDEGWRIRRDGTRFWASVVITAVRGPSGEFVGFSKVTRDLTERRNAEEKARRLAIEEAARAEAEVGARRFAFLAQASKLLSDSLDLEATLGSVTQLAVPQMADWCAVRLLDGDSLKLLALAHVAPEKVVYGRELDRRYPPTPDQPHGDWMVVRTGTAELIREISDSLLSELARDPEHLEIARGLGLKSAMVAPLVARGRILGTLTFVRSDSSRRYEEADLAMAVELAGRCAVAIDNARMHGELRQAVEQKEEALRQREALLVELEREHERLETVIRQMPAGLVIAEAPSGRIALANEQAELLLGASIRTDTVGRYTGFQPFHSDGRPYSNEEMPLVRALWQGEVVVDQEVRIHTANGNQVVLLVNAAPIRERHGRVVAAVSAFQDITVRKQVEEMSERQAHFRERFIGILGHDLRNPLNAILLSSQMLLRQGLPEAQVKAVARVASSADRMKRMINDLLDLTRSRLGGGIPISPRLVNLREVCRHVFEEHEVAHPSCELRFEASGSCWGEWDADRIAQVLSNLLGNAIQYGRQGTPVRVSLRDAQEGGKLELSVHNEGSPIPGEILPALFDPFRRGVHPEGSLTGPRGLGLGLFIAHQIVLEHGGSIDVRSSEVEGTTFTVSLPRRPPARR